MATCKDCLHHDVCVIVEHSTSNDEDYYTEFGCDDFKDESQYAEVIHSEWILREDGSGTCRRCGKTFKDVWDFDNWQHYCGHCGAEMDG